MWLFLTIGAVNKDIKSKINFADNNVLWLFDVLTNFTLTKSETKRDY